MISEWNRLGQPTAHMPADYPYQWSSNVANLAKQVKSIVGKTSSITRSKY